MTVIVTQVTTVDGNDLVSCIQNIYSDSSKVKCIELVSQKLIFNYENILAILQNISSDSSTLSALKIFIKLNFKADSKQLLEICHTISSNSTKCDCILAFDKLDLQFDNENTFCKALAAEIDDCDYYLKAAKKLNLDDHFVQGHKPEKKSINISSIWSNDDEPTMRPGVYCVSSVTKYSNGQLISTKKYSDGSVYINQSTV